MPHQRELLRVAPSGEHDHESLETRNPPLRAGHVRQGPGKREMFGDIELPRKPEPPSSEKRSFLARPVDILFGGSTRTRGEACSQTPCRRQSMPHAPSPDWIISHAPSGRPMVPGLSAMTMR